MNICCINPPIEDFYATSIRRQPLGLLYVMAALRDAGHEVLFINGHTPKSHAMDIPEDFSYIVPWLCPSHGSPRFPFRRYYHFGMSWQEMERRISRTDARVFFISSLFTTYHEETARIVNIIRARTENAIITVGGYHAALYPHHFLNVLGVDYVITGEGETASVLLMEYLSGKGDRARIPGLAYSENNMVTLTDKKMEDIHALPHPARDLLLDRDFRMYRKKAVSMITSRGCPHRCEFCTGKSVWGYSYRTRLIDSVIREIDECRTRYGAHIVNFEDDNLFAEKERSTELLRALADYNRSGSGDRALEFTAMNGISLEKLSEETIQRLKEAGFHELNISLVTHSSHLQERYKRPFDSESFAAAARTARNAGFNVRAYYILGLPGQTRDEVEDTLAFLKDLNVKIFPSVYYNVNAPREQWKTQRSSAFYNETEHLTRKDLLRYFNLTLAQ